MEKALYSFSWDPITYWHIDIVQRAARHSQELIVAIGQNPDKRYLFSLQERKEMARHALSNILNVSVESFEWLLVKYAYENNIPAVFRWIRNSTDLEYERVVHEAWATQWHNIETFPLFADPQMGHISSSTIKWLIKEHADIYGQAPLNVKQAIEAKMNNQYFFNITWAIGSGKSFIGEKLVEIGEKFWIQVTNIDLDSVWHEVLESDTLPVYESTRQKIIDMFGTDIIDQMKWWTYIDRSVLSKKVFQDKEKRQLLNQILRPALMNKVQDTLAKTKGLILINNALTAEFGMSHRGNNNTVLIDVKNDIQFQRVKERTKLSDEQTRQKIWAQLDTHRKRKILNEKIKEDNRWEVIDFDNSESFDTNTQKKLEELFRKIVTIADVDGKLRRNGLMNRLNVNYPHGYNWYKEVFADRSQDNRHHHGLRHRLKDSNYFSTHRHLFKDPDTAELARSHHDSIQQFDHKKTWELSDEYLSAQLLFKRSKWIIDEEIAKNAAQMIECTWHFDPNLRKELQNMKKNNKDTQLLLDINFSPLWKPTQEYKQYCYNIFQEYKDQYSIKDFMVWRAMIISNLLERNKKNKLYLTPEFNEMYNEQTEKNLQEELKNLEKFPWDYMKWIQNK